MKIKTFAIVFLLVLSIISGIALTPATPVVSAYNPNNAAAVSVKVPVIEQKRDIMAVRFLNMLNHNFVYGEDFWDIDEIVNLSTAALYKSADEENPEFLKQEIVFSYINDMYGIEVLDAENLNPEFPKKSGYIYIIPRGYTVYKHSNPVITANEDGTFTVTTSVSISTHDGENARLTAVSLFRVNESSSFGYNIVSSDIIEAAVQL
ncbi:MAG: hypothetical protein PUF48_01655 [Oscillospiraceae bacterium]|nr:hypothetical protein [Oscillospiraceae bacterium]